MAVPLRIEQEKCNENLKSVKKDLKTKRAFFIMCVTLWHLPPVYVGSLRARTTGRRNSILESCKGSSTLPPKPFRPFRSLKNSVRHKLYEHPQPLWQSIREWRTDALFQNLQLITLLQGPSSTADLVQTYQKPIGYQVMFFVDAICQQYFIPILRKFHHFLSQIQSFMFSFM